MTLDTLLSKLGVIRHRLLEPGEALVIGDEYQTEDGAWKPLTIDQYTEVCPFRHYYDPDEGMSPFRRSLVPNPQAELLTQTILMKQYASFKDVVLRDLRERMATRQ